MAVEVTQEMELKMMRRLIIVTGGKGGVGKSTFARGLLDILIAAGIKVSSFDGDPDNSQLFRYYQHQGNGVRRIELAVQGKADVLVNQMAERTADLFLVDVAAGGSQVLMKLEDDIGLFSTAERLGYRITIVSVISRIKDSLNILKSTLEMTAEFDVDHVVVKNLYFGKAERFLLFEGSKTKQLLLDGGGVVLTMPDLFDDTYELLDQKNLPFRVAMTDEGGLKVAQQTRVFKWLKTFGQELKKTAGMVGL